MSGILVKIQLNLKRCFESSLRFHVQISIILKVIVMGVSGSYAHGFSWPSGSLSAVLQEVIVNDYNTAPNSEVCIAMISL